MVVSPKISTIRQNRQADRSNRNVFFYRLILEHQSTPGPGYYNTLKQNDFIQKKSFRDPSKVNSPPKDRFDQMKVRYFKEWEDE